MHYQTMTDGRRTDRHISTTAKTVLCHASRGKKMTPYLETPKVIGTKSAQTTYGTKLYHRANFHADRREISVSGQKIHIFPYRGLPPGGYCPMLMLSCN